MFIQIQFDIYMLKIKRMKDLSVKLQYIIWPFFLISSISIVGLTGLFWLFRQVIDYSLDGKVSFFIILIVSIIVTFISFIPRILTIRRKNVGIVYLTSILTITIPTFYAQKYIQTFSTDLFMAFLIMLAGQFIFFLLILDTKLSQNELERLR